ncbi:aminoimidazole riboside kinase [Sansalvadorimonas verongulae]|uniref:aminoimidazole riboside kinase n=1 Tax=Sansalvadorimonas verongulae TaxID=2172824 RepID=UPI002E2F4E01|nr:aminoimidazole riboside kinase [Sansalvadorimonas verongulae]MTI15058.1 aminoimidazole riboside kinase [Sansalvadorimonas verongulae]
MAGKVWSLGDAVVDLLPDDNNRLMKCPGGAPANVAVAVARLGVATGFIGAVGQDPIGRFLKSTLMKEGVDTSSMVAKADQRSGLVLVDLDDEGERTFTFMVRPSADQFLTTDDLPEFCEGDWLHVCSIALANEPVRSATLTAMEQVKRAGGRISFDPNLRSDVWANPEEMFDVVRNAVAMADVVKVSLEELAWLTQTADTQAGLTRLKDITEASLIVVTLGAEGALFNYQGQSSTVPSLKASVVDTTGAGDGFVGGMLAGLSQYDSWPEYSDVEEILRRACLCGMLVTQTKGAMQALPTQSQLDALAASRTL